MRGAKRDSCRGEHDAASFANPHVQQVLRRARPVELHAPGRIALIDTNPNTADPAAQAVFDDFSDALTAYARSSSSSVPDMVRFACNKQVEAARDDSDEPKGFDAAVIAVSLPADASSAHHVDMLERAWRACTLEQHARVYAIAMSDAYAPDAARDALLDLEAYCDRGYAIWCGGIALGAGNLIVRTRTSPRMGTLRRTRSQAIDRLIAAVRLGTNVDQALELAGGSGDPSTPDILTVSCPLPRFLYRHIAKA